jgi:hypothetical protein
LIEEILNTGNYYDEASTRSGRKGCCGSGMMRKKVKEGAAWGEKGDVLAKLTGNNEKLPQLEHCDCKDL